MTGSPAVRVLIVDDEPLARQRIADMLKKEPGIEIVGERDNGIAAVDYLVKPFDDERFEHALQRARRIQELREVDKLRSQLLSVLQGDRRAVPAPVEAHGEYLQRIPVEMKGKVRVVPVSEIDFIIASGPYAELYSGDRKYVIRESMQTLEDRLDPDTFIRVHRSVIVRLDLIETLHWGGGGDDEVQLKNGRRLRVSRSRLEAPREEAGTLGRLASRSSLRTRGARRGSPQR